MTIAADMLRTQAVAAELDWLERLLRARLALHVEQSAAGDVLASRPARPPASAVATRLFISFLLSGSRDHFARSGVVMGPRDRDPAVEFRE